MEGKILCIAVIILLSIDGSIAAGEHGEGSTSRRGKSKSLAHAFKEENAENDAKEAFTVIANGKDHITKEDMTLVYEALNDNSMTAKAVEKLFNDKGKEVLTLADFEEMYKDLPLHMDKLESEYKSGLRHP